MTSGSWASDKRVGLPPRAGGSTVTSTYDSGFGDVNFQFRFYRAARLG